MKITKQQLKRLIKEEVARLKEGAFSGNGPLSEPIEELGGLRYRDDAGFEPDVFDKHASRGVKDPTPIDIVPTIKQGLKDGHNISEEGVDDLYDYVEEKIPGNLDVDVFNAALDLIEEY